MSRALIAWAATLVMAVAGSQVAHAVAYRLMVPAKQQREQLLADTGHGYLAYWWLVLALGLGILMVALLAEVLATRPESGSRLLAWRFALVSIVVFVTQEHLERLMHDGAVPWRLALEATFLVALALQLPFAVGAYLVARLLLSAARALGGRLGQTSRRRTPVVCVARPHSEIHARRVAALALGYGERGPPAKHASPPAPQVLRTWKRGAIRNRRHAVARRTGLTGLAVKLVALFVAPATVGHTEPASTTPAQGAVIAASSDSGTLRFTEPVESRFALVRVFAGESAVSVP